MPLNQARILLTGATGGLGQELARQLHAQGAYLLLTGRDTELLGTLQKSLGKNVDVAHADLNRGDGIANLAQVARTADINLLINNAGASAFDLFENQPWPTVDQVLLTCLHAPIHLTHTLLPWLRLQPQAAIVNIGSSFGSIPFPGFVAYSAAKSGLKGFSQALRRELYDTHVSVIHISPRAIRTALNNAKVIALNHALNSTIDEASSVAEQILDALIRNVPEVHIGFPESLIAKLNGSFPGLIDRALGSKLPMVKQHASACHS